MLRPEGTTGDGHFTYRTPNLHLPPAWTPGSSCLLLPLWQRLREKCSCYMLQDREEGVMLDPVSPQDNMPQFPQQWARPTSIPKTSLFRSCPLQKHPVSQWLSCYQQNLANCPLLEWQSVLYTSFDYFKCYLSNSVRRHLTGHLL